MSDEKVKDRPSSLIPLVTRHSSLIPHHTFPFSL